MAVFDLVLNEGFNAISVPLVMDTDDAKWSNILQGVAVNAVRTLTGGEWQDYIRGRDTNLNDFDSVDYKKGYIIDVVRVGATPVLTSALPNTLEQQLVDYNDSVYENKSAPLTSIPLLHTGALWLLTTTTDYTNTDASFITFSVDRAINLYVAYDASATTIPTWLDDYEDTEEQIVADDVTYNIYRLPDATGSISIPGNRNGGGDADNMYLVFVEENLFPIEVTSPVDNQITLLNEGKTFYLDRLYIVLDLPEEVEGIDWIRVNNDEYTNSSLSYFQAEIEDEGYVYVAYPDAGCPVPEWLEAFDELDVELETSALTYKLFRNWYDAGTVTLGGASAPTSAGPNATPGANYLVGIKKIGPASVTISLEGEEPSGIIELPITGTTKGGISLIGFPKSNTGEASVAQNIDARGLQYSQLMRLRKGVWDSYVPTRNEDLNWNPADLERGLGYIVRSSTEEDQVLEIDYDA